MPSAFIAYATKFMATAQCTLSFFGLLLANKVSATTSVAVSFMGNFLFSMIFRSGEYLADEIPMLLPFLATPTSTRLSPKSDAIFLLLTISESVSLDLSVNAVQFAILLIDRR